MLSADMVSLVKVAWSGVSRVLSDKVSLAKGSVNWMPPVTGVIHVGAVVGWISIGDEIFRSSLIA